jgi:hypothetical protein
LKPQPNLSATFKFMELFAYLAKYGDELRESRTLVKTMASLQVIT